MWFCSPSVTAHLAVKKDNPIGLSQLTLRTASTALFLLLAGGVGGVNVPRAVAQSNLALSNLEPIRTSDLPPEVAFPILHRALHEAVWGPPVRCQIHQEISLNSQRMIGTGDYLRGGQGRLVMRLKLAAGNHLNNLLQVSDGDLLYTEQEVAGQTMISRVDLGRVRERLTITTDTLNDPTIALYLAIGGQAELLRQLCQQYQWEQVSAGELNGVPVWRLRGKLTKQAVSIRAQAPIDSRQEDHFPTRPTEVLIAIGREDAPVPFWLYEVQQRRTKEEAAAVSYAAELSMKIGFEKPMPPSGADLSVDLFQFRLGDEHFTDETIRYLPPAHTAASSGGSVPR